MNLDKSQIIDLLPHREPMLLIDELRNIKKLHSATAIMNVKKNIIIGHNDLNKTSDIIELVDKKINISIFNESVSK